MIKKSSLRAALPTFVNKTIANFKSRVNEEEYIIPLSPFDKRKKIGICLPFCPANEKLTKKLLEKLHAYTNSHYIFYIIWQTKLKSIFNLKDKNR